MAGEYIRTYAGVRMLGGASLLRRNLNNAKMHGLLDFTETKGLVELEFCVQAVPEIHDSIVQLVRKINSV